MIKAVLKQLRNALPFKKQLFTLLRPLHPPESVFRHLYFQGWFRVRVGQSHFVMKHQGFQLENNIFWKGLAGWEPVSMRAWIALCTGAKSIMDIGANTGLYALVAKAINPTAKVNSFEPVTRVFRRLEENIHANEFDIEAHCMGMSNFNGEATIYDLPSEHVYSVTINKNLNDDNTKVIPTQVAVITLDEFAKSRGITKVDLIKLDVETHEPEVLEGAFQTLSTNLPAILIEILNDEVAARVEKCITHLPYAFFVMDEGRGPILTGELKPHQFTNYLLCPKRMVDDFLHKYERAKIH